MTSAASVERDGRRRVFCALTLPDAVLDRLVVWQEAELRGGRVVPRANLHVTLAFLGFRPVAEVESIVAALRETVAEAGPVRLRASRYRETRSVGMLVLEDDGGAATALAAALAARLERLGAYVPERRPWLPHLTVLRFRERPRLRPPLPDLGTFSPSGAAVYHSVLRPGGARYDILDSLALGG